MNANDNGYANETLKAGDRVAIRTGSDIHPGTVLSRTKNQATVQLHQFRLLNGPKSGEPDAMTFTPGGFCGHWEGTQRNDIDGESNNGPVRITWRAKDRLNGQVGVWRKAGSSGGIGRLDGVIYGRWIAHHDYNF